MREKVSAENRVREIRQKTRKKYSSEEKVRIVPERLDLRDLCENFAWPVSDQLDGWDGLPGN
jgi:hypothetical protein